MELIKSREQIIQVFFVSKIVVTYWAKTKTFQLFLNLTVRFAIHQEARNQDFAKRGGVWTQRCLFSPEKIQN